MKAITFATLLIVSRCLATEWVIVEGGLSPNKQFAVAVYPQKTEFIDEADGTVLLVDARTERKIGPLEEVDSTGGTWGKTTENVRCQWSPDSKLLLVNFRTGRLMGGAQFYRVAKRRAIPVKLPDGKGHPKSKVLDMLTTTANPGSEASFAKDGAIIVRAWGFMPKAQHIDEELAMLGLKGFDGVLIFRHELQKDGSLRLTDITTDPGKN